MDLCGLFENSWRVSSAVTNKRCFFRISYVFLSIRIIKLISSRTIKNVIYLLTFGEDADRSGLYVGEAAPSGKREKESLHIDDCERNMGTFFFT